MKIYTKTGDKGETSFIGGRISKASDLMELIGTLDELNAIVGIVNTNLAGSELDEVAISLTHIQNILFNCGTIAADINGEVTNVMTDFNTEVNRLEKEIDEADAKLPVLQNFILPGGSLIASYLHLARTCCRRAERRLVILSEQSSKENKQYKAALAEVGKYLNRLSDWFFVYARFANKQLGVEDREWNKLG